MKDILRLLYYLLERYNIYFILIVNYIQGSWRLGGSFIKVVIVLLNRFVKEENIYRKVKK